MRRPVIFAITLMLTIMMIGTIAVGCSSGNTDKIKIVTSTSLMEYIVKQVGGDLVEITNLVPPNQHPGNFDIKPSDIQNLAQAKLFLLHGWPGDLLGQLRGHGEHPGGAVGDLHGRGDHQRLGHG